MVPAHEPLLMIESFGTLVPHSSPLPARVIHWNVTAEDCVELGQVLADLELIR